MSSSTTDAVYSLLNHIPTPTLSKTQNGHECPVWCIWEIIFENILNGVVRTANEHQDRRVDAKGLCVCVRQVYDELSVLGVGKVIGSLRVTNMIAFAFFHDQSLTEDYLS